MANASDGDFQSSISKISSRRAFDGQSLANASCLYYSISRSREMDESSMALLLDSLFLVLLRIAYFALSRKFLLATLNPTLREISSPETLPSVQQDGSEYDTEDDGSSYPPSPALSDGPTIELEPLTQKLKTVGMHRAVLHLSHGKTNITSEKQATRGLNRAAK